MNDIQKSSSGPDPEVCAFIKELIKRNGKEAAYRLIENYREKYINDKRMEDDLK